MSDDGETEYPLPPEEEVGASDAQRAGGDAEAVRRASKERRETIVPALDGEVELQGAAGGLDSGGAEGAAEEAGVPTAVSYTHLTLPTKRIV